MNEWQLWIHPYPTLVKDRGRRLNPSLLPVGRVFQDGEELIRLSDLFETARRRTSPQLKRCVRAIAKENDGDVSKAFAICTKQLQKHGYLKLGTQRPTRVGQRAGRSKAAEKGHNAKVKEYEDLLTMNRRDNK